MPTIFSHAVCATAVGYAYASDRMPARFWVLTALCSMLPDADVVGFAFGIRYSDMFGHRGFSHSILFAIIVGCLVSLSAFREKRDRLMLYFTLITLSHPLLDMLTDGGLGVALFAPFSAKRYFFPWRPIEVSPIGAGFFSSRGLEVFASELIWVWLPSLAVALIAYICRRFWRTSPAARS